ncbi:MAG: hypothetical protein ACU843_13465 [Gammaproteobacteria bacterium]
MKRNPLSIVVTLVRHKCFIIASTFTLFFLSCAGCQIIKTASEIPDYAVRTIIPGLKTDSAVDPVAVQEGLLRFADQFAAAMTAGIDNLRRDGKPISPVEALKWKILFASESSSIASGSNPIANLLDMTVFATVTREIVEDHWQPGGFGDSAKPLLESCRVYETEIWKLAATVLNSDQQMELHKAIQVWQQEHPLSDNLLDTRAVGFAGQVSRAQPGGMSKTSVFALLGLDPLSGLDPAAREIAETRLFAERALYIARWMPYLLRWQTELLSLNAMAMPEMQQWVANTTRFAEAAERFAGVAEELPDRLSMEREELLKSLRSQEQGLTTLSAELRQTLDAGSRMSTSVDTTLTRFDALMQRFGVGESRAEDTRQKDTEPFRILDYAETAVQLESTARQLTEMLGTLERMLSSPDLAQLSARAAPLVERARMDGEELVDYAFRRAVLLLVIFSALLLFTLQMNRWLRFRFTAKQKDSP